MGEQRNVNIRLDDQQPPLQALCAVRNVNELRSPGAPPVNSFEFVDLSIEGRRRLADFIARKVNAMRW